MDDPQPTVGSGSGQDAGDRLRTRDNSGSSATQPLPARRRRRFDPNRRDRIAEAALEVVAEYGVAESSLRRIAVKADVPLGSLTYHFTGLQDLLATAFERLIAHELDRLEGRFEGVTDAAGASRELLILIDEEASRPARSLCLSRELQALALRDPECRRLARAWINGTTRILQRHFDPVTAEILEILVEGLTVRRFVSFTDAPTALAKDALRRVLTPGNSPAPYP
ncbi:TetR/AcrR family transcriptional regulator [Paenarthrobacter sp. A20]|uniref:TetR/AcrR family transcriptional regulator n=1 Tax=Paenarthrobacter sp. A20 TaxID=2817891 RepID=UPI00209FE00D|nr:TetR family transcriptional regulator [Paenarthrobacter sp. A20]MCP1412382.1 DNA-binding transcriptional regulator YbjK [Paenarthrobacter sp. A20]